MDGGIGGSAGGGGAGGRGIVDGVDAWIWRNGSEHEHRDCELPAWTILVEWTILTLPDNQLCPAALAGPEHGLRSSE